MSYSASLSNLSEAFPFAVAISIPVVAVFCGWAKWKLRKGVFSPSFKPHVFRPSIIALALSINVALSTVYFAYEIGQMVQFCAQYEALWYKAAAQGMTLMPFCPASPGGESFFLYLVSLLLGNALVFRWLIDRANQESLS